MKVHVLACSSLSLHAVSSFVWAAHKNFAVLVLYLSHLEMSFSSRYGRDMYLQSKINQKQKMKKLKSWTETWQSLSRIMCLIKVKLACSYIHRYFTTTVCSQINLIGSHLKFERFAALRYCFLIPRIVSLTFKQGYTRFFSLQKDTNRSSLYVKYSQCSYCIG